LSHGARDLVDGVNGTGRNPTSPRPADQMVSAGFLVCSPIERDS